MKLDPVLSLYIKINTKWVRDLNVKSETEITARKHRETLQDIGAGDDFSGGTPKDQATIVKLDKWDFIRLRNSCTADEITNRIKRKPT